MRKGLDLTVATHDGIPEMVKGDATRLKKVLTNLTSNVFQKSVEGVANLEIRQLRTKDEISTISITFQDLGIGISEQWPDVSCLFRDHKRKC